MNAFIERTKPSRLGQLKEISVIGNSGPVPKYQNASVFDATCHLAKEAVKYARAFSQIGSGRHLFVSQNWLASYIDERNLLASSTLVTIEMSRNCRW